MTISLSLFCIAYPSELYTPHPLLKVFCSTHYPEGFETSVLFPMLSTMDGLENKPAVPVLQQWTHRRLARELEVCMRDRRDISKGMLGPETRMCSLEFGINFIDYYYPGGLYSSKDL